MKFNPRLQIYYQLTNKQQLRITTKKKDQNASIQVLLPPCVKFSMILMVDNYMSLE